MNLYLSRSRILRILSFSLFYVAQGLPIGLISVALPAWLAAQGAAPTEVAYFIAISNLPWGFKLFAGPIMDRFSFLALGRRRPWIIASQGALLFSIIGLGATPEPVANIILLTWLSFTVNVFASVQDVAVDGMAIDVLEPDERGRANAFMAFGQVAGYSGAGAICGIALVSFGLPGAATILAIGVGGIFTWGVLVREREGEKLLPWTEGEATARSLHLQAHNWASIFANLVKVMFLPASILLMLMALFWRIQAGVLLAAGPIVAVNTMEYTSSDYSSLYASAGFAAAIFGLFIGPLIDRSGTRVLMLIGLTGLGITHLTVGVMTDFWMQDWFLPVVLVADQFMGQIVFICFIAMHMNVCWEKVAATQFAIYMAWSNLSRSIGAGIYGELQPVLEMGHEFLIMGVSAFVGAAFLLMVNFDRHTKKLDELREG